MKVLVTGGAGFAVSLGVADRFTVITEYLPRDFSNENFKKSGEAFLDGKEV